VPCHAASESYAAPATNASVTQGPRSRVQMHAMHHQHLHAVMLHVCTALVAERVSRAWLLRGAAAAPGPPNTRPAAARAARRAPAAGTAPQAPAPRPAGRPPPGAAPAGQNTKKTWLDMHFSALAHSTIRGCVSDWRRGHPLGICMGTGFDKQQPTCSMPSSLFARQTGLMDVLFPSRSTRSGRDDLLFFPIERMILIHHTHLVRFRTRCRSDFTVWRASAAWRASPARRVGVVESSA
jgi:hypothetical protein